MRDCTVTNFKQVLSVWLAAATLVIALVFFASSMLLMQSWFAIQVTQLGLGLESSALIFAASAIALSTGAFFISWKQRSVPVAGLLVASGVIFIIHPLSTAFMMHSQMATAHMGASGQMAISGIAGPIIVIIISLAIIGLGVAKGTRKAAVAAAR